MTRAPWCGPRSSKNAQEPAADLGGLHGVYSLIGASNSGLGWAYETTGDAPKIGRSINRRAAVSRSRCAARGQLGRLGVVLDRLLEAVTRRAVVARGRRQHRARTAGRRYPRVVVCVLRSRRQRRGSSPLSSGVAKVDRDGTDAAGADVGDGFVDGNDDRVRLGRCGQVNHCLRQWDARLRETDESGRLRAATAVCSADGSAIPTSSLAG